MAVNLSLEAELGPAIKWTNQMIVQLPFATSVALNKTAYQVQQSLNYETSNYFDRPTTFTKKAFRFTKSTKTNLEVIVGAAPIQSRYLRFGISGGSRPDKGFERKFLSAILGSRSIPSTAQLVPTSSVRVNAQGNVALATIRTIQKGLNSNSKGSFFYGQPKGGGANSGKPFGIYRRSAKQITPYFVAFGGRASYRPQFPILKLGTTKANQVFGSYLRSSMQQALATAR